MKVIKRSQKPEKYVPKSWEGQEGSPYLLIRKLSRKERAFFEDKRFSMKTNSDIAMTIASANYDMLIKSIVGWHGLENENGEELVWKSAASSEQLIESEIIQDSDYQGLQAFIAGIEDEREDAEPAKEAEEAAE